MNSSTGKRITRSMGDPEKVTVDASGLSRGTRELQGLGVPVEKTVEAPDRIAMAVGAYVLVDKFQEDIGSLAPDMAFRAIVEDIVSTNV